MKIVLWIGSDDHQRALAGKLHDGFILTGIVIEKRIHQTKWNPSHLAESILERILVPELNRAWKNMKQMMGEKFPFYPPVPILEVSTINDPKVKDFTEKLHPELILVSGTSLIRSALLKLKAEIGILNLHTGLSPYVKGGPNCTNWCLATNKPYLIGNTVMWIDEGIDTGNIFCSEMTKFEGNENLESIHMKVMEHAHQLYYNSVESILKGNRKRVAQNAISEGKTYYSRNWGLREMLSLKRNLKDFRNIIGSREYEQKSKEIVTISIG